MSAPADPVAVVADAPDPRAAAVEEITDTPGEGKAKGLGLAGWISAAWLIFIIAVALLAPLLPIPDPTEDFSGLKDQPVLTDGHLLGGDGSGRDVLARVVWGSRASLAVGLGAIAIGVVVGGGLGLISGFRRGRIDAALSSLFDIFLAFPQLVLALALVAFLNPPKDPTAPEVESFGGLSPVQILIVALGIVSVPLLARITRATTLSWAQREFVLASRAQGAKNSRLMIREVLPNVVPAMFSIALLGVAVAIIAEGGLSILGVGVAAPTPSWGNMISENRSVQNDPLNALFAPLITLFLTVMALNYLGDAIRDKFDARDSSL